MPYHVRGTRSGAVAMTTAWIRSAMARSDAGISAIFASTSASPSALLTLPRALALFSSCACSFIAARSSSVQPSADVSLPAVRLADFFASFIAGFLSASSVGDAPMSRSRCGVGCPAELFDLDLTHLQHRLHRAAGSLRVGIIQQLVELARGDLPRQ